MLNNVIKIYDNRFQDEAFDDRSYKMKLYKYCHQSNS